MLKAWTDRRPSPRFNPEAFLAVLEPRNFRWTDLNGLVPRNQHANQARICRRVRDRFGFLTDLDERERELLDDQTAHRDHSLHEALRAEARKRAAQVPR